jgi:hypothetical protein
MASKPQGLLKQTLGGWSRSMPSVLDDVIDHPPLRTLAPRHRPANRRGLRNGRRWGVERLERLRAVVAARVADCGKLR